MTACEYFAKWQCLGGKTGFCGNGRLARSAQRSEAHACTPTRCPPRQTRVSIFDHAIPCDDLRCLSSPRTHRPGPTARPHPHPGPSPREIPRVESRPRCATTSVSSPATATPTPPSSRPRPVKTASSSSETPSPTSGISTNIFPANPTSTAASEARPPHRCSSASART